MSANRPHVGRLLLITAFAALLSFGKLGAMGLHDPDETRYAEIAREMLELGDFIVPHLNYVIYLDKPPLTYWATCFAFQVFGLNEFAARVVPALSGLLCVIAVYLFGGVLVGEQAAFRAAIVLSTSALFFFLSRTLLTDMMLTLFVTLAIGFLYLSWKRGPRWLIPAYLSMALGAMTKGPVAVLLPALPMGFLAVRTRGIRGLTSLVSGGAILAFAAIWLPWHIAIYRARPEFYSHFFLTENLGGFFRKGIHHARPAYYTIAYLALGFIPWTLFLPTTLWGVFSRRDRGRDAVVLCLAWAGTIVLLFSLSVSKLPTYILPALPPLALLVGVAIPDERVPPLLVRIAASLLGAGFCVGAALAARDVAPRFLAIAPEIRNLCILALIGVGGLTVVLSQSSGRLAFGIGGLMVPVVFVYVLLAHSPQFLEYRSPRAMALQILEQGRLADVASYGQQHPNLCFYLRRRQILVDRVPRQYRLGLSIRPNNNGFLSSKKFLDKVKRCAGFYCFMRDTNLDSFQKHFAPCFRLVAVFPYDDLQYLFVSTGRVADDVPLATSLPDWRLCDLLASYGFRVRIPLPKETPKEGAPP